jgi:L-alanine-DL-glutamate epimerase-like enolase superfamily enzyme
MTIRGITLLVTPGDPRSRRVRSQGTIEQAPNGGRFTHSAGFRAERPDEPVEFISEPLASYDLHLRLSMDGGLFATTILASGFESSDLEWQGRSFLAHIAPMLRGVDPYDREYIWQKLFSAQRFFYTGRIVVDQIDNLLWDFASRQAKLPIWKLLGGARDRVPAYRNIGGATIDALVEDARRAKAEGYRGCKDHSYRGARDNIELAKRLRAAVGDGFFLMHDAVWSYDYADAVRVGRVLESLHYLWMEEPLMDYDLLGSRKLCATLKLPILAQEWIGAVGGQPYNAAAPLALKATDLIRQRGIGITGQVKMAQLAETFGVDVHGGNPHVVLAIQNDPLYEALGWEKRPPESEWNVLGFPVVENGYLSIVWSGRPAPEVNWDELEGKAVVRL